MLWLLLLLALSACGGGGGGGQPPPVTRFTLNGTVQTPAGAAVSGAQILLGLNPSVSNSGGQFSYTNLPAGDYVISAGLPTGGFVCQRVSINGADTAVTLTVPDTGSGLRAVGVTPPLNAADAPLDSAVVLAFSTNVDPASVALADFTVTPQLAFGALEVNGATVRLLPELQLPRDQLLLIELTGEISASDGGVLAVPVRWRFRTSAVDGSPPRLTATVPANGASHHPPNLAVTFSFSEALGELDAGFTLAVDPAAAATARLSGRTLQVSVPGGWAVDTFYAVTLTGVQDTAGNRLTQPLNLEFTTGSQPAGSNNIQPEWNRVLDLIVFASDLAGSYDVFTVKPDGSELTQRTSLPGSELQPTLSNDGRLLAYQALGDNGKWHIYVQDLEGVEPVLDLSSGPYNDTAPFFSRTFSNVIVFVSDRVEPVGLFTMNYDGSNPVELDRAFGSDQAQPSLHPLLDNEVLFVSGRGGDRGIWRKTVSAVNGESFNQALSSSLLGDEQAPVWAPDASYILFISDQGGVENLWIVEPTGAFPRQISNFSQPVSDPSPSPVAGASMCVVSIDRGSNSRDLALVDLISGELQRYLTGQEAGD